MRGLYREQRRVSLVDVTEIDVTGAGVRAVCVLVPAAGLDNNRPERWPIFLGAELSVIGADRWGNGYVSLSIEFGGDLVSATTAFAEELARDDPGGDHNEAVIAFMAASP
jgi:hypothetical protein